MTAETTVYVVRHGQTPWTASERVQGWAPVPLNGAGAEQMEATATFLADRVDGDGIRVVTSDLRRARESAEVVAAALGEAGPLETDEAWRERNFGVYQGLSDDRYHGDEAIQAAKGNGLLWAPENGESWRAVETRVLAAWERLRETLDGEPTVLVSHTGPILCLLAAVSGRRLETAFRETEVPEAGVARVVVDADGARLDGPVVAPYE